MQDLVYLYFFFDGHKIILKGNLNFFIISLALVLFLDVTTAREQFLFKIFKTLYTSGYNFILLILRLENLLKSV